MKDAGSKLSKKRNSNSSSHRRVQDPYKVNVPLEYTWQILNAMLADLGEFLSVEDYNRLYGLVRNRSWADYDKLTKDWSLQCSEIKDSKLITIRIKRLFAEIFSKFLPSKTGLTPLIPPTFEKFRLAEQLCFEFNKAGWKNIGWSDSGFMRSVLTHAQRFCGECIGFELPEFELLTLRSRHGPGANLDTKDGQISTYYKYGNLPYSCTEDCQVYAKRVILNDQRWSSALWHEYCAMKYSGLMPFAPDKEFWDYVIKIVPGNKIGFVSKNRKINRSIAIEPALNLYLQLGVDGFVRRRLQRWNVNLNDQRRNNYFSQLGSTTDQYSTLDLSMASDTVSTQLVKLLLPTVWYNYMSAIRSPKGDVYGEEFVYEKFSSMGNGFTFALESLIFSALIYGVSKTRGDFSLRDDCCVFGDDIIVPSHATNDVISVLQASGFRLNTDKSFTMGLIRESCGTDWWNGHAIRPFYIRRQPVTVKDLYLDLNRFRRWGCLYLPSLMDQTCLLLTKWVPESLRFYGPLSDEELDSYIHTTEPSKIYTSSGLPIFKKVIGIVRKDKFVDRWHIRKLMCNLRGGPIINHYWSKLKYSLPEGSSIFDVVGRQAMHLSVKSSHAIYWRVTYTSYTPPPFSAGCGLRATAPPLSDGASVR